MDPTFRGVTGFSTVQWEATRRASGDKMNETGLLLHIAPGHPSIVVAFCFPNNLAKFLHKCIVRALLRQSVPNRMSVGRESRRICKLIASRSDGPGVRSMNQ